MTTALLLLPVAQGAIGLGAGIAGAQMSDALRNDADIHQGGNGYIEASNSRYEGGGADSFANCQMSLLFNTIVANMAAAEGLGLVEDDDDVLNGRLLGRENGWLTPTWDNTTATSTCEQSVGAVVVSMESAPGWGEPAPQENGLGAMASSLWETQQIGLDGAMGAGLGLAGASMQDVLENDVDVSQSGGVNSASSCQMLVAWNTMIVNAAAAAGTADVHDNDTFLEPLVGTLNEGKEWHTLETENDTSTSSCRQSIASLTLVIGETPTIPPQS